jgi:hypothetical protein
MFSLPSIEPDSLHNPTHPTRPANGEAIFTHTLDTARATGRIRTVVVGRPCIGTDFRGLSDTQA